MVGDLDLSGLDAALAVAALASASVWLLAAGALYLHRRPPEPPVGPKTLEVGPEPPAVANFLANDFRVTAEAVPATLVDLAARNVVDVEQRGPGVYYVRLRSSAGEGLTPYERRILDHLRRRAHDGVVPAGALTTGRGDESSRWFRAFEREVIADAQARGLSRDALAGPEFTWLTIAAVVPALLVWALFAWQAGALVLGAAIALLGWIRARHTQRETPEGLAAASRWLGVRAELAENEIFETHSPLTVEIWDRHLAYGAALGVASGASRPLPMGAESDTHAWSTHSGRWRSVRVSYPRFWPPAWGWEPPLALLAGAAVVGGLALFLYFFGVSLLDAGALGMPLLVLACAGVVGGVAVVVMAALDWKNEVEVTGPILRLRAFGDDDDRRYYVAVDDGVSDRIRGWRVDRAVYERLAQGDLITARLTPNLACVRFFIPEGPGAAG